MPTVIGGKLKLKGSKSSKPSDSSKKKNLKRADSTRKASTDETAPDPSSFLTETQKKHKKKMDDKLKNEIAKDLSAHSYRERVEAFNHKLSTLTEHNDIPRVSAAGNG